jgi:hypothetical protein
MTRLYFDQKQVSDLSELVDCYSASEFESPFRSTVPLLAFVRDESSGLREMLDRCTLSDPVSFHFEFQVLPAKGRGKASHTDLMVCAPDGCMAVEAKWTEPAYEKVGDWLKASSVEGDKGEANRNDVLSGWIDLLQRRAVRTIAVDDLKGLTYQTVHRAASACSLGSPPQLAYLQFSAASRIAGTSREVRLADLQALRAVLGSGCVFPLRLIEVDIEPTAEFEKLTNLPKSAVTAMNVKAALVSRKLFAFKGLAMREVP